MTIPCCSAFLPLLLTLPLLFTCSGVASADSPGVELRFRPGGEPALRSSLAPRRLEPTAALALPHYRVSGTDPDDLTTLMAVRNTTDGEVTVRVRWFERDADPLDPGAVFREDTETLAPHATRTWNLQLLGLPGTITGIAGHALVEVIEPATGAVLPTRAIAGDWFSVDPGNDFASGSALVDLSPTSPGFDLCDRWITRFFAGGAFDGGTVLTAFLLSNPTVGTGEPVLVGNVYDEIGAFQGVAELVSGDYSFTHGIRAGDLPVAFGSIEWMLAPGALGNLEIRLDGLERFSISTPAICAGDEDGADADDVTGVAGWIATLVPELASTILELVPLAGTGPLFEFDSATGTWTADLVLPDGSTVAVELVFVDDQGFAQESWETGETDRVELTLAVSGDEGDVEGDLILSGLAETGDGWEVDGALVATDGDLTATVLVQDLAMPGSGAAIPDSGHIVVSSGGARAVVTFDGTTEVLLTVTAYGITETWILDLETGELTPA